MANFVTMEEMQEQIARLKNIHKRCKKPKALGYKPEKTVRKRLRLRLSKTLASETDFDAKADFSNGITINYLRALQKKRKKK